MPDIRVAAEIECAHEVADLIIDRIDSLGATIGLATGRSTVALHSRLGEAHRTGRVNLRLAQWVMLDELLDIDHRDPRGFRASLIREFVSTFDPSGTSLIGPRLDAGDVNSICARFARETAGVRPDIQVLGIGRNGHVGFNEPGSAADSRVRVVHLAGSTRGDFDPEQWQEDERPHRAVTRGIADLHEADTIVLLAFGPAKAVAVRSMLCDPISTNCPASLLRDHRDMLVFLDADAAQLV